MVWRQVTRENSSLLLAIRASKLPVLKLPNIGQRMLGQNCALYLEYHPGPLKHCVSKYWPPGGEQHEFKIFSLGALAFENKKERKKMTLCSPLRLAVTIQQQQQ